LLESRGFQVIYRENANHHEMNDALETFLDKLSADTVAMVYYAGHGMQINTVNYLIPTDIQAGKETDVLKDGIDFGRVLDRLSQAQTKFALAVIDACHDNPFLGAERSAGEKKCLGPPVSNAKGIMLVYAAGSNQESLDRLGAADVNPNGLFMRELLKAVQRPGMKVQDAVRAAKQDVADQAQAVGYLQSPAIYDHSMGTFYFSGTSADGRSVTPLPEVAPSPKGMTRTPGLVFQDCPDCPEMMAIPAGRFLMGSSSAETTREGLPDLLVVWEHPQHPVKISSDFALGKHPVTRGEFAVFVHDTGYDPTGCFVDRNGKLALDPSGSWRNPGFAQSDDQPAVCLSYEDAERYVAWLNAKVSRVLSLSGPGPYRLPSEAEWEYAARAGTTTARWWGDGVGSGNANCHGCGGPWDGQQTNPVGSFRPNPFGLFDMLGNVFQWTEDCGHWSYSGAPSDGKARGAGDCGNRVARGGSWYSSPRFVRSANRQQLGYDRRMSDTGFRLARTLP
jgi:formylglycine-generating enzyme required for sulfatase activity